MYRTTAQALADQMTAQAEEFDSPENEGIFDLPLEITVRKQLVVVLCTGGPHVEAVAELDDSGIVSASLDGYWAGSQQSRPVEPGSGLWNALEQYAEVVHVPA